MVASALLKYCHRVEDTEGFTMELQYLRHRDGREVDFVVTRDRKIQWVVEAKLNDTSVSPGLAYFRRHIKTAPMFQVHMGKEDYESLESGLRVLPSGRMVGELGLG